MTKNSDAQNNPHIALIGLGLIGSSLGHAFKEKGVSAHITGYARSKQTREKALEIGFVDSIAETPAQAVAQADIVFLNVPIGAIGAVMQEMAPGLKAGAIVTDVGSVKRAVIDAVKAHLPENTHFVPGHPIAGTEHSGPEAGFASLFENRWCILTPEDVTDAAAVASIQHLWEAVGSRVEIMDPDHHDLVLAITSHVPHLIAFNIVGTAADLEAVTQSEVIKYSAGGFRDFTRIASSDPVMWRDVFLNNGEAVLEMLGRFSEDLTALQRAIRWKDGDALESLFTRTRQIRRDIIEAGQETDQTNFGRKK
ncbi:MAG: prephenate/arogenate dehydrogenase family protein [Parvibaculales bacterium]